MHVNILFDCVRMEKLATGNCLLDGGEPAANIDTSRELRTVPRLHYIRVDAESFLCV